MTYFEAAFASCFEPGRPRPKIATVDFPCLPLADQCQIGTFTAVQEARILLSETLSSLETALGATYRFITISISRADSAMTGTCSKYEALKLLIVMISMLRLER